MSTESKYKYYPPENQSAVWTAKFDFFDIHLLRDISGMVGQNLKILEKNTYVQFIQSAQKILIRGEQDKVEKAVKVFLQLLSVLESGASLHPAEIDQSSRMLMRETGVSLVELSKQTIYVGHKKKRIYPRSLRQKEYFDAIKKNDLVFGVGPAGTGKTYLAMAMALSALKNEEVKRIILCRPAVEAGEKLGFLPGDLIEKVNPYLRPLYDALFDLFGAEKGERLIERQIVEVAPLAFMRGRTLSDAFVILDEAQNTTPEQMKMFLTRIGVGSKAVVTGDPTQVDLPRSHTSGLRQALRILEGIQEISIVQLTDADVVRHPLVSAIIRAYAKAGKS